MAKIHPSNQVFPHSSPVSLPFTTSKQETFTIWMKSLILGSKGCTVFDSNGQIVYRVDNYNCKCIHEVYLMDFTGKLLFTIRRKKLKLLRLWEGYRSSSSSSSSSNGLTVNHDEEKRPVFQVRRRLRNLIRGDSICQVIVRLDKDQPCHFYQIESCSSGNSSTLLRIVDNLGGLIAEVRRKQSKGGISLGEDVLTMVVEPHIDPTLIMGLVIVHSLIKCKM